MEQYLLVNYLDPIAKVWGIAPNPYPDALAKKSTGNKKRGYQKTDRRGRKT
jgi:hypothetical protein